MSHVGNGNFAGIYRRARILDKRVKAFNRRRHADGHGQRAQAVVDTALDEFLHDCQLCVLIFFCAAVCLVDYQIQPVEFRFGRALQRFPNRVLSPVAVAGQVACARKFLRVEEINFPVGQRRRVKSFVVNRDEFVANHFVRVIKKFFARLFVEFGRIAQPNENRVALRGIIFVAAINALHQRN